MISPGDVAKAALWVTGREGAELTSDPVLSRWGISLAYHPEIGAAGIRAMTQQRAAQIFVEQYWVAAWSGLPQYLATPLLSFSVVEGPEQAALALQRALVVKADGLVGPQTCAVAASANKAALLEAFFAECMARFKESPRWVLDDIGWCRRQFAASCAP